MSIEASGATRLDEAVDVRARAECLVSEEGVAEAVAQLAAAITTRLAAVNPLVYVVMNGGLMLGGALLPRLAFPLELAYLHATRYRGGTQGHELEWRVRPAEALGGRHVLVVDDVLDEGHTLAGILDDLRAQGAAEVLSVVLVDKRHAHKARADLRADFTGMELPDRYLFGCGMDYKGYWRNLPAIYALPET